MKGTPLTKPMAFLLFFFHSSSTYLSPIFGSTPKGVSNKKTNQNTIKFCQASFIEQSKLRTPPVVTPSSCNKNLVQKHKKPKPSAKTKIKSNCDINPHQTTLSVIKKNSPTRSRIPSPKHKTTQTQNPCAKKTT